MESTTSAPARELPRVLVVDDEQHNLDLLSRALRQHYRVRTAASGADAIAVLDEHDIDVIVTDQRMPGISGVELLGEAVRRRPFAKRLLLTAHADSECLIRAINDGHVHYYVRKPWKADELRCVIDQLCVIHELEAQNRSIVHELSAANHALVSEERLLRQRLEERGRDLVSVATQLRALNEELQQLAERDSLTRLYTHGAFQGRGCRVPSRLRRVARPRRPLSARLPLPEAG